MVEPTHFRVDYSINPYMDLADQPDPALAWHEWRTLKSTIERLGGRVDVIEQRPDTPDMVYAMNLGLGLVPPGWTARGHVTHALPPAQDGDRLSAQQWFADARVDHVVRRPRRRRRPLRGR